MMSAAKPQLMMTKDEERYVYPLRPWLDAANPACVRPEGEVPVLYHDLRVGAAMLNPEDHLFFRIPDGLAGLFGDTVFPELVDEVIGRDDWGRPTLFRIIAVRLTDLSPRSD